MWNDYNKPKEPTQPTKKIWQKFKETNFAKYQEFQTNLAIVQAAYQKQKTNYKEWTRRQQVELPGHKLLFKSALQSALQRDLKLVERVKFNPMWLRLVIAIYGGYYNYNLHSPRQNVV